MLWLPYVTAEYVRVTGDTEILRAIVPFLDGPTLRTIANPLPSPLS